MDSACIGKCTGGENMRVRKQTEREALLQQKLNEKSAVYFDADKNMYNKKTDKLLQRSHIEPDKLDKTK